ncbi:carbohydrate kinase family protein [Cryobacterium glucosi]|uniref:Carbohydrate kinase n=1 Tax=Cryobacterium glucosi TaxID=1259175 RepID=A0ABY2IKM5_9MICO|nr:carbohydrate kinase [Cryobacterium glucosi]TFC19140.1 carbohydrate kinase [Cryobacterium glucosi]
MIVVIGEALTDIVANHVGVSEHPGGSPMNVAIGVGRLGLSVSLLTSIGNDDRGAQIRRRLTDAGVELVPGSIVRGPTSTATAHIDASGTASYDFDIHWSLSNAQSIPAGRLLHTGSIAAFLEPGASSVAAAVVAAAQRNAIVTFDPNIRPSLLGSHTEVRIAFEALARSCDIVKLSEEDAFWLYPELSIDAVLDTILRLGPGLAAITLGADGAILSTVNDRIRVAGVPTKVADTIGAGDSFMSGLIFATLQRTGAGSGSTDDLILERPIIGALTRRDLTSIGEFSAACAAITVSRIGAEPPTLADIDEGGMSRRHRP